MRSGQLIAVRPFSRFDVHVTVEVDGGRRLGLVMPSANVMDLANCVGVLSVQLGVDIRYSTQEDWRERIQELLQQSHDAEDEPREEYVPDRVPTPDHDLVAAAPADPAMSVRSEIEVEQMRATIKAGRMPADLTMRQVLVGALQRRLGCESNWRACEAAESLFGNLSLPDLCGEILRMDGRPVSKYRQQNVRDVLMGRSDTLASIFGSTSGGIALQAYDQLVDTTDWVEEVDLPHFKAIRQAGLEIAPISILPAGGTASSWRMGAAGGANHQLARFAGCVEIDEADIIDDEIGVLSDLPKVMGEACRRLKMDLVYSLLLQNPTLSDGGALFNATAQSTAGGHANLGSSALSSANLQSAINSLASMTENGTQLHLRPDVLLVPMELRQSAAELVSSTIVLEGLQAKSLRLRDDSRLGANGCVDPRTGDKRTGSATAWYLVAAGRSVRVGYRQGTGRKPVIRSGSLPQGRWGVFLDVYHDLAAQVVAFQGIRKGNA